MAISPWKAIPGPALAESASGGLLVEFGNFFPRANQAMKYAKRTVLKKMWSQTSRVEVSAFRPAPPSQPRTCTDDFSQK